MYKPQDLKKKYNAKWALVTGASSGIGNLEYGRKGTREGKEGEREGKDAKKGNEK